MSRDLAQQEALRHLLAVMRHAVELLDEVGADVDARVLEAHAAQIVAGREWPGDPIAPVVFPDGSTSGDLVGLEQETANVTALRRHREPVDGAA